MDQSFRSVVVLIVLVALLEAIAAIRCYKCDSKGRPDMTCEHFDASSRFHVDCPRSAMCLTKVLEFELQNSTIVRTFERGCVPQQKIFQTLVGYKWQTQTETIGYREGCMRLENDIEFPIEYCRCRGDLCNKVYYAKNE